MRILFLALACVAVAAAAPAFSKNGSVRFPGLMLCAEPGVEVPVAGCVMRMKHNAAFQDCGESKAVNVTITGEEQTPLVNCRAFFTHSQPIAEDVYAIVTLNSTMNVKWTSLFDARYPAPTSLDEYSDLIYMYEDAGLVTITGSLEAETPSGTRRVYGNSLHTHHYGVAPQDIWLRFDPMYTEY